jgi:DNA polymerase/3'-5' exonuclease PolX
MDNRTLAERLTSMAHDLEQDRASLFRIRAYRRAAETILSLDRPVEELVTLGGRKELAELPGIGRRLSRTIEKLVRGDEVDTLKGERRGVSPMCPLVSGE